VEGFFQQIYDRIPIEVVRETLSRTVQAKLGIEAVAADQLHGAEEDEY